MATTDRQNRLLVAEDWRKIYQAFQQADFKSYDFETLRRTMVAYLKENYPDDFNDFVESSEYVALIDLIAYISQALSFRVDLNARENFLETAERRNSVLRLARLINYNAKRNKPATGMLKLDAISTTQDVQDSTGTNLANSSIIWNDSCKLKLQRTIHCDTERGQPDRTTIWQSKRIRKDRRNRHRGVHIKFQPVRSSHIQFPKIGGRDIARI